MIHTTSSPDAVLVGIDWGTTHRRVVALDHAGRLLREFSDDQGLLQAAGRFRPALAAALQRIAPLAPRPRVLLAGMVGSAQGWHEVPYLDTSVPLQALRDHLVAVPDAPPGLDCRIVPGLRWRGEGGHVDVMRGEETQLLGAVTLGHTDGVFVLPGTHSKWVSLRDGRVERFATYLSGELFALLSQHGTLAPLMREPRDDDAAFVAGLAGAAHTALSNALFECRARVVSGGMAASSARDHLSGILIGSEWQDALQRFDAAQRGPLHLIGTPELAARHGRAAQHFGVEIRVLDARELQCLAWRALAMPS